MGSSSHLSSEYSCIYLAECFTFIIKVFRYNVVNNHVRINRATYLPTELGVRRCTYYS